MTALRRGTFPLVLTDFRDAIGSGDQVLEEISSIGISGGEFFVGIELTIGVAIEVDDPSVHSLLVGIAEAVTAAVIEFDARDAGQGNQPCIQIENNFVRGKGKRSGFA